MLHVKKEGLLLKPSSRPFESKGVFNPAAIKVGRYVHMFYRAWDRDNHSTIGYCKLDGPLKVVQRSAKPILYNKNKKVRREYEDPRIVKLGNTYYLTYIVYDGKNVSIHYAVSKNLKQFKEMGQISPNITYDEAEDHFRACQDELKERYFLFESYFKETDGKDVLLWDKDAFLFPKKINGQFALVHRILPDIQVIYFKKFSDLTTNYWRKYLRNLCRYVILESKHWYETRNVGGGCPPIETDKGWLLIYHAVDDMDKGKTYRAGAALLDKKNPTKVIGHHHEPLFSPTKPWEKEGNVKNVVFPTGTAVFGDLLYIYYGAADKYIAAASVSLSGLVDELARNHKKI
ncbi:MAG TPA: pesticidal protein Cry7Aa [Candidatus Nanoarchaeia archaeon]|nr:pesticidal protein Cry7Aa [Candidatus Nanoarchaeia archaeon]